MKLTMPEKLEGRHVLYAFVAFFLVVFGVNIAMVFLALDTWSGLTTERPYERGLRFNETVRAAERSQSMGWSEEIRFTAVSERQGRIELRLSDRDGRPLDGLSVAGELRRPTHEGFDRPFALAQYGPGHYVGEVEVALKGAWDLRLRAVSADGSQAYGMEQRVIMP